MGPIHRYIERRRVLRLLAELEKSLCKKDRSGTRHNVSRPSTRRASV